MKTLLLTAAVLTTSFNVMAAGYISDEFNTTGSQAAIIYTCAVTGAEKGYAPQAFTTLQTAFSQRGANMKGRQASNLIDDSYRWYKHQPDHFDFGTYWHQQCAQVFARMESAINA